LIDTDFTFGLSGLWIKNFWTVLDIGYWIQ